jgi:hypothetical protein
MTTTSRQNNLLLNQDWTRIYQTFKNADFKSYDFENLRRVILTYLRENYPEDFNDYIESSEYMALIDAVAFLGQSLSFRIDLASRENFIELADRRESVLRLAKMLGYNAKRNIASSGLLKFTSVTTTEDLIDSNGKNLANQIVSWNDPTNADWVEQFIQVLNSAMSNNTEFGRSQGSAIIQGILTEQYRFNTTSSDIPIYAFSKSVAGRSMAFEVVSTSFKDSEEIYEESPLPGNQLGFVYKNDSRGPGSANTGFYLMFKQGSLELADFSIEVPTPNERVSVDSANINNDDLWLYRLNSAGAQVEEWTQVSSLIGNNIAFNSLSQNIRNVYSVVTKESDRVDLVFADGVYGNLPQGTFRLYYRVSNGLQYTIAPNELRGINISIPYLNKRGARHTLKVSLALQSTVASAAAAESTNSVRVNAPAQFYTQNRMVTAEDYSVAPLASSQEVIKVKSINRTSSGISRNFDIIDSSGKYSAVNVFANDGYIYKEQVERVLGFKFISRIEIINFIKRKIEPIAASVGVYNFYLTKFDKILFPDNTVVWENITKDLNQSTGYFNSSIDLSLLRVGSFATNNLKYVLPGAMVKFTSPLGKSFKNGELVDTNRLDPAQTGFIWVKVIRVFGDGTNAGRGALTSGQGPIVFNNNVPSGAIASRVVPKFSTDFPPELEAEIVNQMTQNLNFGLRFDETSSRWKFITVQNIDLDNAFSLGRAGDSTNNNLDSSWVFAFVKEADEYIVRVRTMDYVFGSVEENRFYFDKNERTFNDKIGKVIKDQTRVLGINFSSDGLTPIVNDIAFEVSDTVRFSDGFESNTEVKVAFEDSDRDGIIDNPDSFEQIVGPDGDLNFLFFKETVDSAGNTIFTKIDNSNNLILVREKESQVSVADFEDGQLIYFYDTEEDRVKRVNKTTNTLILESSYKANIGRDGLKFQYIHNANVNRRIDPSVSNIIDIFMLIRSYDEQFRIALINGDAVLPEPPSSESLRINYGSSLSLIKTISDEIIYHPAKYKILFGPAAEEKLQAKFKIVKNPSLTVNDNDLKVRVINAINEFFDVNNWDFGDRFYLSELTTFILNTAAPDISNLAIVPRQPDQKFGSLFEVSSGSDEIFVSGATVDDIEIVPSISVAEVGTNNITMR